MTTNKDVIDRAKGCFIGMAVGDALGVPLEFSKRDSIVQVTDMIGGGPFNLKPGEWTDDTSMGLALAQSLIDNKGELNGAHVMDLWVSWWREGTYSVNGRCFDIGNTCRQSLQRWYHDKVTACPAQPLPRRYGDEGGNGSLMRLGAVSTALFRNPVCAAHVAREQSLLTHDMKLTADACANYAIVCTAAINGLQESKMVKGAFDHMKGVKRSEIVSDGYSMNTLRASLWSIANSSSFEDALILAVNLGGDSDTTGAVCGQLAGAIYGYDAIPDRWKNALTWRGILEAKADELIALDDAA